MLSSNGTNSNVVEIQQLQQQNNSTPSSEDLLKHMQSLEKRIKSLEVTNRVILGLFIGTLAAAITVGAGFAIAAAPIIAGSIVGGILATAALAALGVTAYKYRAEMGRGFKYAVEKTVEGAKYIGGKIKDGAVHAKDKVKEGYENTVDSLKRGASFVGEGVANKFHKASGETDYLDKIKRFAPDEIKKSDEIKNDMKAIFADKGNNSGLVKNILSGISSKIDLKIAEEAKSGWEEYTPKWQVQKEFINNLNEKSLHSLLTQRSLPKGSYFIDSIFSEHHDEIKEVIKECKENHLYSSVSNMFNKAEKRADRPSFKSLTRSVSSSFSSLGRKGSEQSNSLSKSNSLNSTGTESTATVSDSDSQNFATVRRSNSSSSLTPKLTPVASPKVPGSSSTDSGRGSSINSDPFGSVDSGIGFSDPLIPEKPRTYKSEVHISLQQPEVTASK